MEEKDQPSSLDPPENISSSENPVAAERLETLRSASPLSFEPEIKTPALSQRLASAFREGVASARSGTQKPAETRAAAPKPTDRNLSDQPGILDRVIQEGEAAASVLYDKAADVLDSAVQLAKKAPDLSTKWVEAFRLGATSVRSGEVKAGGDQAPRAAGRLPAVDRGILDRVTQAGDSAAEVVRGALASIKPGEVRGAERKIRLSEKTIRNLYVEIGREAADSWSAGGSVETEKVTSLLDELRKHEEEIENLRAKMAEVVAARKAEAGRKRPAAKEDGVLIVPENLVPTPTAREIEAPQDEVGLPVVVETPTARPEDQTETEETAVLSPDLLDGDQTGEEAAPATPEEEHPALSPEPEPPAVAVAEIREDLSRDEVEPIESATSEAKEGRGNNG